MGKRWLATLFSCLFFLAVAFALRLQFLLPLSTLTGERTYYLNSPSSQAVCVRSLGVKDIFRVRGQSVRLDIPLAPTEIAERYGASLVKTERTGDIVSYYYRVSGRGGVCVDGEIVNLHIAVSPTQTMVGAPLIFGGY